MPCFGKSYSLHLMRLTCVMQQYATRSAQLLSVCIAGFLARVIAKCRNPLTPSVTP